MDFLGVEIMKLLEILTKRFCIIWLRHEQFRIEAIIMASCPKYVRFLEYLGVTYAAVTLGADPTFTSVSCRTSPSLSLSDLGMYLCL
jgi:hypothetical protein